MNNAVINTILATAFAAAMGWLGPALDVFDDHGAEVAQAKAIEDAQRAAQARQRFERAAQAVCGSQAAWREAGNGVVQCFDKRARPTVKRSVGGAQQ